MSTGDEIDSSSPAATPGDAPAWADATRPPGVPARTKLAVVATLGALVLAAWVWSNREHPPALGDRGRVVAEVDAGCPSLRIETDGLVLANAAAIPSRWGGQEVSGQLTLTERMERNEVAGVFLADDGTSVEVIGGPVDEKFLPLGCAISVP